MKQFEDMTNEEFKIAIANIIISNPDDLSKEEVEEALELARMLGFSLGYTIEERPTRRNFT